MAEAALDDVFIDDITLPATDGYPLGATLFLPRGAKRHAVLINSATATPRKIYKGFAGYLARRKPPRNLGEPYTRAFDAIYPELAAKHGLLLYPFFLDGVALNAKLNLDDGLHPNSRGVAEITKKILPSVEQLIERARAKQAAGTKG